MAVGRVERFLIVEVYFDNAATTKIIPEVRDIMLETMDVDYGNPSSVHIKGVDAEKYIKDSKKIISRELKCDPNEIVFTSGGTEANNLALAGIANAYKRSGNHIITTSIEHASVYNPVINLEEQGFRVTFLPVDSKGVVSLEKLREELCDETILVSIMAVNNEIGTIEPIEEVAKIIKEFNEQTGKSVIYFLKIFVP